MKHLLFILILLPLSQQALSKSQVFKCKVQLVRMSEAHTEVLPKGTSWQLAPENKEASASLQFDLNTTTDQVYKIDLHFELGESTWKKGQSAFKVNANLTDLKNNQLIASGTFKSDEVRTPYLLEERLLGEGVATVAVDLPSTAVRAKIMNSDLVAAKNLAQRGKWLEAGQLALAAGLVSPFEAEFASIFCTYKD